MIYDFLSRFLLNEFPIMNSESHSSSTTFNRAPAIVSGHQDLLHDTLLWSTIDCVVMIKCPGNAIHLPLIYSQARKGSEKTKFDPVTSQTNHQQFISVSTTIKGNWNISWLRLRKTEATSSRRRFKRRRKVFSRVPSCHGMGGRSE